MLLSAFFQVSLFLYFGIPSASCRLSFSNQVLVFERIEHEAYAINDSRLENFICLGTNVHFHWVVMHKSCLNNRSWLPKLGYNVLPLSGANDYYDDLSGLQMYEGKFIVRSSDLILLRLRSPIQIWGLNVTIGIVPKQQLSKPTKCKILILSRENISMHHLGLKRKMFELMAYPNSRKELALNNSGDITVYIKRNLCKSVLGSILSCNDKIQGVAGTLVEESCMILNQNISFADLAKYTQVFYEFIDDFDWVQSGRIQSSRDNDASCLGVIGYAMLTFILIVPWAF